MTAAIHDSSVTRFVLGALAMLSAAWPQHVRPVEAPQFGTFLVPIMKPVQAVPAFVSSVAGRVAMVGNCVLLADGYAGLGVYEIGASGTPRHVGDHPTGQYARTVQIAGHWAYVSDSLHGLVVFDLTDCPSLKRVERSAAALKALFQQRGDPGLAGSESGRCLAAVVDHRVYIARDDWGVVEIEMRTPRDLPPPPMEQRVIEAIFEGADSKEERVPEVTVSQHALETANDERTPDWEPSVEAGPVGTMVVQAVPPQRLALGSRYEQGKLSLLITGSAGQRVRIQQSTSIGGVWEDWGEVLLLRSPQHGQPFPVRGAKVPAAYPTDLSIIEPELEIPIGQTGEAKQMFYRAVSP